MIYDNKDYKIIKPTTDKVLLQKIVNKGNKKYGDIIIPHEVSQNSSLGVAKVIDLGTSDSIKDSGIKIGDYVLYDYYSAYKDNKEYIITKIENIILQLSEFEALEMARKKVSY